MRKKSDLLSKKIVVLMLCVFMMAVSVNPGFTSYAYANSTEIQGVFNETLSEDKTSSVVDLKLDVTEDKTIESVTLPDQTKIVKEDFKLDNNKLLIEYTATENKNLEFIVEYTKNQQEMNVSTENSTSQVEATTEVKKETLSYEVKDIVIPKEPTLQIDAKDITYKVGEEVDFRKGVVIKNENGKDITEQISFDIKSYGGYSENMPGIYDIDYEVKHPISNNVYKFKRKITIISKNKILTKEIEKKTVGIKLSSGNATLVNPNDFKISDKNTDFNVTVSYTPENSEIDRMLKIFIPENFSLTKQLTTNTIDNAKSIDTKSSSFGTEITIEFENSASILAEFDISLRQNYDALYDKADKEIFTPTFKVEAYKNVNSLVSSDEFHFTINQLGKVDLSKATYTTTNLEVTTDSYRKYNRGFSLNLNLKKGEFTSLDIIDVKIPVIEGITPSSSVTTNMPSVSAKFIEGKDDYWLFRIEGANFYKSYTDKELVLNFKYSTPMQLGTANERNYFRNDTDYILQSIKILTDNSSVELPEGKLRTNNAGNVNLGSSSQSPQELLIGSGGNNEIFINKNINYDLKDAKITYSFPFEIRPMTMSLSNTDLSARDNVQLITNKRKIDVVIPFGSGNSDYPYYDLAKHLDEDEYIKEIIQNSRGQFAASGVRFEFATVNYDENGEKITVDKETVIKTTVSASNLNNNYIHKHKVVLKTLKDNLVFNYPDRNNTFGIKTVDTKTSSGDYYYGFAAEGELDTKKYNDGAFTFEGKEALSLLKRLRVDGSYSDVNVNGYILEYTTNLTMERQFPLNDSTYSEKKGSNEFIFKFPLKENEYITDLKIKTDLIGKGLKFYLLGTEKELGKYPINLPLDNNIKLKDNISFDLKVMMKDRDGSEKEFSAKTASFVEPVENIDFEIQDQPGFYKTSDSVVKTGVILDVSGKSDKELINKTLDLSDTDKIYLSTLKRISTSRSNSISKIVYKTNLNSEERKAKYSSTSANVSNYVFELTENEYVTSLKILFEDGNNNNFSSLNLWSKIPRYSLIDNEKIELKKYDIKGIFTADNSNKSPYEFTGKSITIGSEFKNLKIGSETYAQSQYISPIIVYQGEIATIKTPSYFYIKEGLKGDEIKIMDPVFYIEMDSDFIYKKGSIHDINGVTPEVEFTKSNVKSKHSYLKIFFKSGDYEKIIKYDGNSISTSFSFNFEFDVTVKGDAVLGKIDGPVKYIWADFSKTIKETVVDKDIKIEYSNPTNDTDGFQEDTSKEFLKNFYNSNGETLKMTQAGVKSIGYNEKELSMNISGHDNDIFGQEVTFTSQSADQTSDWIAYIPVPKKDQTIFMIDNETKKVVESKPMEYSLKLKEKLKTDGNDKNVKISYTTASNPLFSLDNKDVGNYVEIPDNYNDVTMIKIKISSLGVKEQAKVYIDYEVNDEKVTLGKQVDFTGAYFNFKLGDKSNDFFYGEDGYYSQLNEFALIDFSVFGKVWEEKDIPNNHILSNRDSGIENVTVVATDKSGNTFEGKTSSKGQYAIAVPSHGDVTLKIVLPNDDSSIPKHIYTLVGKDRGTETNSSVFDQEHQTKVIAFNKKDIFNINAGLWAERAIVVTSEDVVVRKGETVNVPAVSSPSYTTISYQNAKEKDIATVSDKGVVTGVELGITTATVTIPDGKGGDGVVTATYNIKVVPADVPSAVFDNITIFEGNDFDVKTGITILDGDKKPIDINDSSKVTIDSSNVDKTTPGKYPIVYTINDGYNEVTVTRYVYVHGKIQVIVPNDVTKKVGDSVTALDGASATYIHINEDGTQTVKNVPVTTPNPTITSNVANRVNVPLESTITINGATDTATGNYTITFNEKAILNTTNDNVTVKVGATLDEIKEAIKASAYMTTTDGKTDLTNTIDWSGLNSFDTSIAGNTVTGKIFVIDPDTGEKVEKEITVTISQNVVINAAKEVNLVVGDSFDPFANVTIKDGDGNDVTLTNDMIISNNVEVNGSGKTTKRGVYEVEYEYTDKYGNTKRAKTTVNVHGKLQFDDTRKDLLQNDSVENINSADINKDLAYYIDATGNKKIATLKTLMDVNSSTIGKASQNLVYTHPVNGNDETFVRAIYVHGHVVIQVPNSYTVKVNTEINTLKNVTASYKFVEDNGTIVDKTVAVSSILGDKTTSTVPTEKVIPVEAHVEVVTGLNSNATNNYKVIFNGLPTITVTNDNIEVRVGATFKEIKNAINASASVQYGNEANLTDLTAQINWDEVVAIDTSIEDKTYTVKINVADKDGAIAEKTLHIKISKGIIINLPSIDKVVGDNYDSKDGVTIFDGQGKPVDINDVTIDDSKVDMSKPGNYEITYTYTDSLGNTEMKTNTIRIHGKLQFEGLDRIDLIEKEGTYLVDTAKAFYINNEGKKVYVDGVYDNAILDQSVVGKNELIYNAAHPINHVKESSNKQNVFIHGDIVFHKPTDILTDKVNTTLDPKTGVSATYDYVNDDGTITTKDIPLTSEDVTSDKVGYVDGKISAEVEIVSGLTNSKNDTVKVAFNGLPYIDAANTIYYHGVVPSKADIIDKMLATAGMKQANGVVINLTDQIDYSDVNRVVLDKNGNYQITLTVTDSDGFTTYTTVNIIVDIKVPEEPVISVPPITPTHPINPGVPNRPATPQVVVEKDTAAAVTQDIPLSEAKKNEITDDFIKSYITASTENKGIVDFEILSHNVVPKVGEYEVTIRLEDGTVLTVKMRVVDDSTKDVQQPEYGHDKDCIIHWIILLLFAGYSIYSITAMLKRRKDNKDLEDALEDMENDEMNKEGDDQDEN